MLLPIKRKNRADHKVSNKTEESKERGHPDNSIIGESNAM